MLNQLKKGVARRFITLIDTLYDNRVIICKIVNKKIWIYIISFQVRVVCTCDVPHVNIFQSLNSDPTLVVTKENLNLMDDLGLKEKQEGTKSLNIFTGEEELFASDRTISRLSEMMTQQYWDLYDSTQR